MRVWVPFRNTYAIGMVVRVHSERPEFETRPVEQILDDEPVMDEVMLKLTEWVHRFYYCSHGEVIQAALPVGLNFTSEKILKVKKGFKGEISETQREILEELESTPYRLRDAEKRWRERSEEHTSELQSRGHLVCRLLLEQNK